MESNWLDYVSLVLTGSLTATGLVLANSYARQRRLKISEDRIEPYRTLWAGLDNARASRIAKGDPLRPYEANQLAANLRHWYHQQGGGMLLPIPTLKMLLLIMADLDQLGKHRAVDGAAEDEGTNCLKRISMLRTQLKIDLDIYEIDERQQLTQDRTVEREFLQRACFDLEKWGRPDRWYRSKSFHWHHYTGRHRGLRRFRPVGSTVGVGAACPDGRA